MKLVPLEQWLCDSCGEIIEKPEDGWFEWYEEMNTSLEAGFRIVHAGRTSCMYDDNRLRQQNRSVLDRPLEHALGPDGLGNLLQRMEHKKFADIKEFIDAVRRLHIPYYEEARQYWDEARRDGLLDGNEFQQNMLLTIIKEYGQE